MTPPAILTLLLATVLGCADDPEVDENLVSDEEIAVREDATIDIDAQIAEDIARQNAVLARGGYPALTPWECCMTAAMYRHENVTDVCGKLPTSRQE